MKPPQETIEAALDVLDRQYQVQCVRELCRWLREEIEPEEDCKVHTMEEGKFPMCTVCGWQAG